MRRVFVTENSVKNHLLKLVKTSLRKITGDNMIIINNFRKSNKFSSCEEKEPLCFLAFVQFFFSSNSFFSSVVFYSFSFLLFARVIWKDFSQAMLLQSQLTIWCHFSLSFFHFIPFLLFIWVIWKDFSQAMLLQSQLTIWCHFSLSFFYFIPFTIYSI